MQIVTDIPGLTPDQVTESRTRYGWNELEIKASRPLLHSLVNALKEPMLILLLLASTIYFMVAAYAEGIFMLFAILLVSFISLYQQSRSKKALEALKAYSRPKVRVVRYGKVQEIQTRELVIGDHFIVEEGEIVPADGVIERSNDLFINEAILTGESLPVAKSSASSDPVYQGTLVNSGLAVCKTTAIGIRTRVGQIGKSLVEIREEKSPLQIQVEDFVRKMAAAGIVIFLSVWAINYARTSSMLDSLLKALTLAMSILPEEIPVAFTTFMALGAWRLAQLGIIVKQSRTIETLGSATVICVDKTGTLTKNEMSLVNVYDLASNKIYEPTEFNKVKSVIALAMWASESTPFDPMEKAIHTAYSETHDVDERKSFRMIHEYPLGGTPPIMTHIFEDQSGKRIIAAKGGPEAFLKDRELTPEQKDKLSHALNSMTAKGFRVLAVADAHFNSLQLPNDQHEFQFTVHGLIAFYDPPKENISSVIESLYAAGLRVKLITGDNAITAQAIAKRAKFANAERVISGDSVLSMSDLELQAKVDDFDILARMHPEAKLKVIEALKKRNHIVAMMGDGVNDAPALKAAHIGIAMGSKGSEVAKQASAVVLANDDLSAMIEAISMGRKIYGNLKKAIQYIISIHIPAVLIVFLPLVFDWPYAAVFTPVHIIILELIMGPTCSIIYENEPLERNAMNEKPRVFTKTFFRLHELATSIIQGLVITIGLLFSYWISIIKGGSLANTTALTFLTLITANIFLTLTNRSFYFSMITTMKYKNQLIPWVIAVTVSLVVLIFSIPALRSFFQFEALGATEVLVSLAIGSGSVMWFEAYKWVKRRGVLVKRRLA